MSSVPAGGGTVRSYHTTQTAGQWHSNCGWIMVGVHFLIIFGSAVEPKISQARRTNPVQESKQSTG